MRYPGRIEQLITNFTSLPGIGQKTAERLVFYLLKNNKIDLLEFGRNLINLKAEIKNCPKCGNYSLKEMCEICAATRRDKSMICIVAEVPDIYYLDGTHSFNGLYYVLGGLLAPAEGVTPDKLEIDKLIARIKTEKIKEIIFGFNQTVEGESTIIYLKKIIKEKFPQIKLTRLSRGLPMGGDLEYADEITLSSAIKNRNEI